MPQSLPLILLAEVRPNAYRFKGLGDPVNQNNQSSRLSGNDNNFDALRFLFASLVVLSHSFPLGEGNELREPLIRLTGQTTLGGLAVYCFFIISGFLIAASWERRKNVSQFLKKRVLRIYPGFIMANLFGVFLVAPLATAPGASGLQISLPQFSWDCVRLQGTQTGEILFPQNFLHALNGSIWSVPYEFWCYIGVVILGLIPLLNRRSSGVVLLVTSLAVGYIFPAFHLEWFGGGILGRIFGYPLFWARLLPHFLAGVVAWRFREKLVLSNRLLILSVAALTISVPVANSWAVLFPIFGTCVVLWLAFNIDVRVPHFSKYGDFSYGMYLYAFPIQQLLVMWNDGSMNPYVLFAIAWPLSILAGILSWYLVEGPFLHRVQSQKVSTTLAVTTRLS